MSDRELASVLAEELTEYLRSRAAAIGGPVYAVALRSAGEYGSLLLQVATERGYEAAPWAHDHLTMSDGVLLAAPASSRWNPGDWDFQMESFCSDTSRQQLDVFRDASDEAGSRYFDDPSVVNGTALATIERRWDRLANDVMAKAQPLSLLASSPDAIAWVENANYTSHAEHAMSMTLTSDGDVLRRLFPHWRRLCDGLDALEPETLARLREFRATHPAAGIRKLYQQAPILTAEMEKLLTDCGEGWFQLAGWDGARVPSNFDPELPNARTCESIALAFVVAERIGSSEPKSCEDGSR